MSLKSFLTASLLLTLVTSAVYAQDEIPVPSNDLNGLCKNLSNYIDCANKIEKQQLKKFPALTRRKGENLVLTLMNGKKKIYINKDTGDTNSDISYYFRDHLSDLNYFLVEYFWAGGEEAEALLLNTKTGKEYLIDSLPIFSPQYNYFASSDRASGVKIWKAGKNSLNLEVSFSISGDFSTVQWLDNETFEGKNILIDGDCNGVRIKRQKGKWQLRPFDYKGSCPK